MLDMIITQNNRNMIPCRYGEVTSPFIFRKPGLSKPAPPPPPPPPPWRSWACCDWINSEENRCPTSTPPPSLNSAIISDEVRYIWASSLIMSMPMPPDVSMYAGDDGPVPPGYGCDDSTLRVDGPPGDGEAPVVYEGAVFGVSAKNSEGEKPSGLLCCEGESPLVVDRAMDGAFLRTGRIHGGRVLPAGLPCRVGSKGICVTEATRQHCVKMKRNWKFTSTKFFHQIP